MLRGTVPLLKMALATTSPLKRVALILFGKSFVPTIAWERCFFREGASRLRAHLRSLDVCLLGGVDSLGAMEGALDGGFACVAMARALLREPDFLARLQREDEAARAPSRCSHCNQCIVGSAMAERPLRCVELDF